MLSILDDYALRLSLADGLLDGRLQLLIGPDRHGSPQLRTQDGVEGLGQLTAHGVFVVDQQALEERQVELPPERASSLRVGRCAVSSPRERSLEIGLGLLEVAFDFGQTTLGALDLPRQPFLLALEQVQRHSISVVSVKQLLALCEQADQPTILDSPFALTVKAQPGQLFFQEGADFDQLLLLELHRRVMLGDDCLDLLDTQGSELAVGALLLATNADEVGVGAAPAFGVADN